MSVELGLRAGLIDLTTDDIRILDTSACTWISVEEAAGRNIIDLVPVDITECDAQLSDLVSTQVFRITWVRPGGEPTVWLEPLEAARLGLFNWETGSLATEWPARPELPNPGKYPVNANEFKPTKWCDLLTARRAGWIYVQPESEPIEWITSILTPTKHTVLETHVTLAFSTDPPNSHFADNAAETFINYTSSILELGLSNADNISPHPRRGNRCRMEPIDTCEFREKTYHSESNLSEILSSNHQSSSYTREAQFNLRYNSVDTLTTTTTSSSYDQETTDESVRQTIGN